MFIKQKHSLDEIQSSDAVSLVMLERDGCSWQVFLIIRARPWEHLSTLLMYLSRPSVTSDLINGASQSTSFQITKLKCNLLYRVLMNYLRRLKGTVPRAPIQKKWTSPCKCDSITFVSRQCICRAFYKTINFYYFRNIIQIILWLGKTIFFQRPLSKTIIRQWNN